MPRVLPILLLTLVGTAWPEAVQSQAVEPRTPVDGVEIGGRVHLQANSSSADGTHGTEFMTRRARVWVAGRVNDWIDGAVQVDMSSEHAAARYAFVRLSFSPAARLSFGQFKRAFDNFELTSSSQILVVERDGQLRGAGECAGVGGVCSYSRFSEKLELSSLDVGVLLQGETGDGRLEYLFSLTNGTGDNAREDNDTKSLSGRLAWRPVGGLELGANAAVHDYTNAVTGEDEHAPAAALDLEVGDFDGGLHLQAGVMTGRNWRNLDAVGDASSFLTWQGIVSYRVPLAGGGRVQAVEPVGRVSWGDPDRDRAEDDGVLFTPGAMLHFQGRNKVAANVDVWRPQSGATVWGLKAQVYLYF